MSEGPVQVGPLGGIKGRNIDQSIIPSGLFLVDKENKTIYLRDGWTFSSLNTAEITNLLEELSLI